MKRIITSFFLLAFALSSFAQSNFYKISIGGGAGITQSFTEVKKHDFGLAGYGTLDYLLTPFASIGMEIQKGEINGGDYHTDPLNRQFVNSYSAFSFNGKIFLGMFMDDRYRYDGPAEVLKGIYLGSGIGVIKNSPLYTTGLSPDDPNHTYTAQSTSKDVFLPINLGINLYFADGDGFYRYVLNFNYQGNFTLGEGLDGYDDSKTTFKSGKSDIYTFASVGVKYNFGKLGLSRKTFRRY